MSTSDKVKAILNLSGKKVSELADHFEMSRQTMSNKIYHDRWSAEDLIKVAAFAECDFFFEMQDGQRIYLFSQADRGRFGPKIPRMNEVQPIGDNKYIDARGNVFSRTEILLNETSGGGMERVSADMFDDPLGTKEDIRRFRKLEKRIKAIQQEKLARGEYPKNEYGTIEIPPPFKEEKPADVSDEEWQAYAAWVLQ